MSLLSEMNDTTNTLAWIKNCRLRNSNAINNTHTGRWLAVALTIIEQQFNEIQDMRNADIDRTGELFVENERLREKLDSLECTLSDEEAAHRETLELMRRMGATI